MGAAFELDEAQLQLEQDRAELKRELVHSGDVGCARRERAGNLYIAYAICYRSIAEEEGGGAVAPVHLLR